MSSDGLHALHAVESTLGGVVDPMYTYLRGWLVVIIYMNEVSPAPKEMPTIHR